MKDCHGCRSCRECGHCRDCVRSGQLAHCKHCYDCYDCTRCNRCSGCNECHNCSCCHGFLAGRQNAAHETRGDAERPAIPLVPDLHAKVAAAARKPEALVDSAYYVARPTQSDWPGWLLHMTGDHDLPLRNFYGEHLAAFLLCEHNDAPVTLFDLAMPAETQFEVGALARIENAAG